MTACYKMQEAPINRALPPRELSDIHCNKLATAAGSARGVDFPSDCQYHGAMLEEAMRRRSTMMMLGAVMLAVPAVALADDKAKSPPVLQKVLDCRSIGDDAARLKCYDDSIATLDAARAGGEVAVLDREDVRKTKRGLFGFSFADLPIFGKRAKDNGEDPEEIKEIVATIRSVSRGSDGGWRITLEDGACWEQTDTTVLGRAPKAGGSATIRRGALGSYKMKFDIGPSVKVRRIS